MTWEQSGLDFIYPAVIVILAMVFLLRGLCRLAKTAPERLIGVKPSVRAFETWEEYRVARVEMDLEQFLDCARITPPSITRYKPHADIACIRAGIAKASDLVTPSILGALGSPRIVIGPGMPSIGPGGGRGGHAGSTPEGSDGHAGTTPVDLRGVLTTPPLSINDVIQRPSNSLAGASETRKHSGDIETINGLKIKIGCGYRLRETGELMRLRLFDPYLGNALFDRVGTRCYSGYLSSSEMEVAIPWAGEFWTYKKCQAHPGISSSSIVHQVSETDQKTVDLCSGIWKDYALCGCVEPFGYGKGKA